MAECGGEFTFQHIRDVTTDGTEVGVLQLISEVLIQRGLTLDMHTSGNIL